MQEQAVSKQLDENIAWWKTAVFRLCGYQDASYVSGQGYEYPCIFKLY